MTIFSKAALKAISSGSIIYIDLDRRIFKVKYNRNFIQFQTSYFSGRLGNSLRGCLLKSPNAELISIITVFGVILLYLSNTFGFLCPETCRMISDRTPFSKAKLMNVFLPT